MLSFLQKIFQNQTKTVNKGDEVVHINQEIYKKSAELSERNKTLLLLRKIDEIILSSITDQNEIARNVTSILVTEADFKIATIFIYEDSLKKLKRLSMSVANHNLEGEKNPSDNMYITELSISQTENLIVQSAKEKIPKSSNTLFDSLLPQAAFSESNKIHDLTGVKSVFIYPLIARGQLIGMLVVGLIDEEQNLSEYSEDLLGRLTQVIGIAIDNALLYNQLRDANEKLKALDKLKDEFVSLASHELRTPMTAIKSYLWMTLQGEAGPLTEKQKMYLERAYSSVDRLVKLVNDMLNISRIESGRLSIKMYKVDLHKLVREVVEEVRPHAEELGVSVLIPIISNPLPDVFADSDKIKEVLFNLLGNSLKFTPKDGSISVSFSLKDDWVETKIKDTGAGISSENIGNLFKKFSMLPDSYTNNKSAQGTGLGLYIAKSIIELHKGKIWVNSDGLGKGSEFAFSLKVFNEQSFSEFNIGQNSEKDRFGTVQTHA